MKIGTFLIICQCISINIDTEISCHDLLARAENLNYEAALEKPVVRRYSKKYNYAKLEQYIAQNKDAIEYDMVTALNENSVNNAVEKLDKYLHEAHRVSKERVKTVINSNTHKMNNVNKKFNVFQESLREGNGEHIAQNLENYTVARKQLHKSILTSESKRWNNILINNDPKKL